MASCRGVGGDLMFIYDLAPGQSQSPYHYEYAEEWLLVVDGTVVLRAPSTGSTRWNAETFLCFAPGPAGATSRRNRGGSPARTLMFSSSATPAVSVYPDSDKIGVFPGTEVDELVFRRGTAQWSDGEEGWE